MLSILIPVYNYNVTHLVNDLYRQAVKAGINFEIIIMEDGSELFLDENKRLSDLEFCNYIPLQKNIGRSAIRNKLADSAKYEYLLFLDCDGYINNENFISRYLLYCQKNCVVLGGRIYEENTHPECSLLVKYGRVRERNDEMNLKKRESYQIFTSPNFLIEKSVFTKVRFDENIKGYGHEDTVFGIMLQIEKIKIRYIDNPVIHVGIEDNETFINKTEKALFNLYTLYKSGKYDMLENNSKILSYYLVLKRFYLIPVVYFVYKMFSKLIKKNLLSKNPSLFLFDIYKLGVLCNYSCMDRKEVQ